MEQLSITTERLWLRNLKASDVTDFFSYRSNPEVTKYQGFDVMTMEQCKDFIACYIDKPFGFQGEWVQYGIEHRETQTLIGDFAIRLDKHDARLAEIGLTISHLHQQKGFAKEALKGIVDWLFSKQNIHRITEIVDEENTASINLLKSVGFRQEGHFIENIFHKGRWCNEYQYSILKREWNQTKSINSLPEN